MREGARDVDPLLWLRVGEVVRLRAANIDSEQMIIRIVQSKGRNDRHVMLPAESLTPLGRCPSLHATSLAAWRSSKAGVPRKRNRSPASVGPTLRVVRRKSAALTRRSSASCPTVKFRFMPRQHRRE
jgi:integrase